MSQPKVAPGLVSEQPEANWVKQGAAQLPPYTVPQNSGLGMIFQKCGQLQNEELFFYIL